MVEETALEGFLTYCKLKGYRSPTDDNYGWARLTQVIANFFGGTLSVGVDICDNLDCTNGDNGVYLIKDWIIVERGFYHNGYEQTEYNLKEFVEEINKLQPTSEHLAPQKHSYFITVLNKLFTVSFSSILFLQCLQIITSHRLYILLSPLFDC